MPKYGPQHSKNGTRNALLLQVAALESDMVQTRALLREQSKQRLRLYSKLNALSPIDQLPTEIKIEIFYNALQAAYPPNDLTDKGTTPLITPFFLGKICQGWRDFVWSSPILSRTHLHLCLSKVKHKAQTNLLCDWLSRTAKCPLSIRFTTPDTLQGAWISNPPTEILTILASVSARWKEVDFVLPDSQDCFDAISAAQYSLPLLTTATAHWITPLSIAPRQLNLFSTAPQLSTLRIRNFYMFDVLAPWHQLQEFTSKACTVNEIRRFLHEVPNIIRCSFIDIFSTDLHDSRGLGTFNRLPVSLEHLEYLELSFYSVDSESTRVLGTVKLPSLREVSLRGSFASSSLLLPIMTSFYSSQLLEKFTFGGKIPSDHDLIQVLESIPSIKDLCLAFGDQDPLNELLKKELLQRLCPHADILLPNLRSFTYDGPASLNEHIHLLRDVLVYRFRQCVLQPTELFSGHRTVCQIQSVTVSTSSELVIGPDIQEELDILVQEGLSLSLKSTF